MIVQTGITQNGIRIDENDDGYTITDTNHKYAFCVGGLTHQYAVLYAMKLIKIRQEEEKLWGNLIEISMLPKRKQE